MDISEILLNVSVLIGIWVAIYGIDSWRRSHVGIRKINLAEDSLAFFYEASDAIKHIRHPMSTTDETANILRDDGESQGAYEARRKASVVFSRYNHHQELFNKLHATRYRFMAQIGKEEAQPFEELHGIVIEIVSSARALARLWAQSHFRTQEQWDSHQSRVDKYESIFWEGDCENDPINPRLDKLIENIEVTCNNVISARGTLYSILNKPLFKWS